MTRALAVLTRPSDPAPQPVRPERVRRRWVRALRSEPVLASALALLLAVIMTWPAALHPATTVPKNALDPVLVAWAMAWVGHALVNQPWDFWQSNIFYPEPDTFALTESFLGYLPFSLVGTGPEAALVRYNVVFIVVAALAFGGAYALARQLGARWPGALVAAVAFAYSPWRIAQADHLHVLSTGGIALTLAALARGHGYTLRHGWRPETARPGWALTGWLVACWQISIGFGIGIPFGYVLGLVAAVAGVGWLAGLARYRELDWPRWKLAAAHLAGGVAFALTTKFMARPYLNVLERNNGAVRTPDQIKAHSPAPRDLITAPPDSWLWGDAHAGWRAGMESTEIILLPGFALIALAVLGVVFSSWPIRRRLALAGLTVPVVLLTLGTNYTGRFDYLWLYEHATGWDALRTPGRLIIYVSLLLALLAAGFVTVVVERFRMPAGVPARARWAAIAVLPALLVLAEGVDTTAHPRPDQPPVALKDYQAPLLVLPSTQPFDRTVEWWSTDGFPKITNGASGAQPPVTGHLKNQAAHFPDAESVEFLRRRGVRTVLVLKDRVPGTRFEASVTRTGEGLPLRRTETSETVVFLLDPWPR